GLDAVRKRPGMYIGSTDGRGLMHCVWEIIDNAVDEALAGYCSKIVVTLHPDGSAEVRDNGRGIPTGINTKSGLSGVELALTKLHAGGKFGGTAYASAGGLHGVGASVVNALSHRLDARIEQDGKVHTIAFRRGKPGIWKGNGVDGVFTPGAKLAVTGKVAVKQTGTTIRFWPDYAIFLKGSVFDLEPLLNRARQTAFLVPGLEIVVRDGREGAIREESFQFTGGIADMVEHLATDGAVCDVVAFQGAGVFKETVPVLDENGHMENQVVSRRVEVNVALRWGKGYDTTLESFANVVRTPNGGTHRKGFERALLASVRTALTGTRVLKANEDPPILEDAMEGLTVVISVQVPEPQFVGQTKDELGTAAVTKIAADVVSTGLKAWLDGKRTKTQAKVVLEKIVAASRVRVQQRQQKDAARRKTALEGASMPAKLADCRTTGVERSELFLVEGDSAMGTAKKARSSEYQALLPLRGKILNVQKASLSAMLANAECAAIIQAIGAGSGRTFDLEQARYGKVLIMADADVDGSHIRTLLLTLFVRYMRPMVEAGRVYSAMPPLFKIEISGSKEPIYTYTSAENDIELAKIAKAGKTVKLLSRFKGLGEMDEDQLWETTMDPAVRAVRRITIEDAELSDQMLELAMGPEVAPRRDWIIESANAMDLESLDV
ncbi:DNA gyrase/topoisomerase IV subunit B, partial [Tessaracoccus sp.]